MSESSQALSIFNPEHKITSPEQWTALVNAVHLFLKDLPQVGGLEHVWAPGPDGWALYGRRYEAPAGSLIETIVHKFTHPLILSQGSCLIRTLEDGAHTLVAPAMTVTQAGTQRIIFVTEDIVMNTVHYVPAELVGDPDACKAYITA